MQMCYNSRLLKIVFVLASIILICLGCSTRMDVNTESTQEYKKEVLKISEVIEKVDIHFFRPNLFCQVTLSEEPNDKIITEILLKTKEYVTLENMNEISKSIKWNLEISRVHLTINTDNDKGIVHEYFAQYFKTSDASNKSEENIDAYQKWYKKEN